MFERLWKKFLRHQPLSLWSILTPFIWIISVGYRITSWCYRVWPRTVTQASVPVISVGNISVGGTGKTPVVKLLARLFLDDGFRVGIVSSGWERQSDTPIMEPGYKVSKLAVELTGDEVKLLATLLPEAIFSVARSKATAARCLSDSGDVDLIIVDDGFQHYHLARDVDIVTYDAAVKRRNLKAFPLGILREPLTSLKRADVILITRTKFAEDITQLRKKLSLIHSGAKIYNAQFYAPELVGRERRYQVKYMSDKSVFLFAGIGNFEPLRKQVDALAGDLDCALELSDHQEYSMKVLQHIKRQAEKYNSDIIVTTGKDWVKLGNFDFGRGIYYLAQSVDLDPGEEKFAASLQKKLNLQKRND
ncbi:MAG: tetraacyldisaccharide 4'-kinase [Candidatus Zixiibacteriota bacterium]|nr:MAG: tetraacyldisaccharide 4'-kinase [candidate division Zixibacteria bacterium]